MRGFLSFYELVVVCDVEFFCYYFEDVKNKLKIFKFNFSWNLILIFLEIVVNGYLVN